MDKRDEAFLLDKKQPFGEVHDYYAHEGVPIDKSMAYKSCGPEDTVPNNGYNHGPSFADKKIAGKAPDPFSYTGKS